MTRLYTLSRNNTTFSVPGTLVAEWFTSTIYVTDWNLSVLAVAPHHHSLTRKSPVMNEKQLVNGPMAQLACFGSIAIYIVFSSAYR